MMVLSNYLVRSRVQEDGGRVVCTAVDEVGVVIGIVGQVVDIGKFIQEYFMQV
jgi:hypothetical protein